MIKSKTTHQSLYFTKPLQHMDMQGIINFVKKCGMDGLDYTVRPGYPVDPDNISEKLGDAVKMCKDAGIVIGMLTAPGEYTSPKEEKLVTMIKHAGKTGIPFIKLGYVNYNGHYWKQVEEMRSDMTELGKIAADSNVMLLLHTHMNTMIHSAALEYNIVNGLDKTAIGMYLDACHIGMRGENFDMAFDIAGEHFKMFAVKDVTRLKMPYNEDGKPFHKKVKMNPLGEGMIDFYELNNGLNKCNYTGPITLHIEYDPGENKIEEATMKDVRFLREHGLIK